MHTNECSEPYCTILFRLVEQELLVCQVLRLLHIWVSELAQKAVESVISVVWHLHANKHLADVCLVSQARAVRMSVSPDP